jgi:hypothetical protein
MHGREGHPRIPAMARRHCQTHAHLDCDTRLEKKDRADLQHSHFGRRTSSEHQEPRRNAPISVNGWGAMDVEDTAFDGAGDGTVAGAW